MPPSSPILNGAPGPWADMLMALPQGFEPRNPLVRSQVLYPFELREQRLETAVGIEPTLSGLQPDALPLGYAV